GKHGTSRCHVSKQCLVLGSDIRRAMSPSSKKGPEMRYLLLMYADRAYARPPDAVAYYAALQEAMTAAGVYVTSGWLETDDDSAVVRIDGDTVIVTEGGLARK